MMELFLLVMLLVIFSPWMLQLSGCKKGRVRGE